MVRASKKDLMISMMMESSRRRTKRTELMDRENSSTLALALELLVTRKKKKKNAVPLASSQLSKESSISPKLELKRKSKAKECPRHTTSVLSTSRIDQKEREEKEWRVKITGSVLDNVKIVKEVKHSVLKRKETAMVTMVSKLCATRTERCTRRRVTATAVTMKSQAASEVVVEDSTEVAAEELVVSTDVPKEKVNKSEVPE